MVEERPPSARPRYDLDEVKSFQFVDMSAWPICVVRFPDMPWLDADLEDFMSQLREVYARREKLALVVDARISHLMNAGHRQTLAKFLEDMRPIAEECLVAMAIVVKSGVVRGAYTAITWIIEPYWDVTLHGTMREAVDRAVAEFEAINEPLSKEARALHRRLQEVAPGDEAT